MNGFQMAAKMRSSDEYKNIPIIVISALSQKSDEELINKAGVDFYLKKPFELSQLSNKINGLF